VFGSLPNTNFVGKLLRSQQYRLFDWRFGIIGRNIAFSIGALELSGASTALLLANRLIP